MMIHFQLNHPNFVRYEEIIFHFWDDAGSYIISHKLF